MFRITLILILLLNVSTTFAQSLSKKEQKIFKEKAATMAERFCDYISYMTNKKSNNASNISECSDSPTCNKVFNLVKNYFAVSQRGKNAKAVAYTQRVKGKTVEMWTSISGYATMLINQKKRYKLVLYKFSSFYATDLVPIQTENGITKYEGKVCFQQDYMPYKKDEYIETGGSIRHEDHKCLTYDIQQINKDGNRYWAVSLNQLTINHEAY